jgi:hypothetical protein
LSMVGLSLSRCDSPSTTRLRLNTRRACRPHGATRHGPQRRRPYRPRRGRRLAPMAHWEGGRSTGFGRDDELASSRRHRRFRQKPAGSLLCPEGNVAGHGFSKAPARMATSPGLMPACLHANEHPTRPCGRTTDVRTCSSSIPRVVGEGEGLGFLEARANRFVRLRMARCTLLSNKNNKNGARSVSRRRQSSAA